MLIVQTAESADKSTKGTCKWYIKIYIYCASYRIFKLQAIV